MYFGDTDVIGEARQGHRADPGVQTFFQQAAGNASRLFFCVVTIGKLRRGVPTADP